MVCGLVKQQVPNLILELLIWSKRSWLCSISCCLPSLAIAPAGSHRKQLHFLLPKCSHNQSGGDEDISEKDKGSTGKLPASLHNRRWTGSDQLNRLKVSTGLKTCPSAVTNGYLYPRVEIKPEDGCLDRNGEAEVDISGSKVLIVSDLYVLLNMTKEMNYLSPQWIPLPTCKSLAVLSWPSWR